MSLGVIFVPGAAVATFAAWGTWRAIRHEIREHGIHVLAWRYATGAHMTQGGTHECVPGVPCRAGRWSHIPRHRRAGIRIAAVTVPMACVYGDLTDPGALVVALIAAAVPGAAGAAVWLRRGAAARRHRRHVEQPLKAALAPFLGIAANDVDLTVRRDFADAGGGEQVAVLTLPDQYAGTADQRARAEEITRGHLGVDIKPQWGINMHPKRLNVLLAPTPPGRVGFADVMAELDARPDHKILLGRASDGNLRWWDTSTEDPHVAVHGGSRRGKTSLLLAVAAQDLSRGGTVTAIDPKRIGLLALTEVPGFTLISNPRDIPAMWDGVKRFRALVESRYDELAADPTAEFPRALLILDEVSQLSGMWAAYWRSVRGSGDPALPPVWGDVAASVWMGAQCRCHVWVAGQRLDYQILGGMLGSFGYRMLAGFTPQDFNRLIGQPPVLRSQKHRGRFLVYSGDDPEWTQLVFGQPEEWRDFALARTGRATVGGASDLAAATSPVSLREAVAAGVLMCSLDAAKRARADDPEFPEPAVTDGQTMLYYPADLRAWQAARPRAGRSL